MDQTSRPLQRLGERLKTERLCRNETQAVFAARLGVSIPTLHKMEQGSPAVMIGYWGRAMDILDHTDDWDKLLEPRENLFEKYERLHASPVRQRASRRKP